MALSATGVVACKQSVSALDGYNETVGTNSKNIKNVNNGVIGLKIKQHSENLAKWHDGIEQAIELYEKQKRDITKLIQETRSYLYKQENLNSK